MTGLDNAVEHTFELRAGDAGAGKSDAATVRVTPEGPPRITLVAVTSGPGLDNETTYGVGEEIRISVTFDQPVEVEGDPQFGFSLGNSDRLAEYDSGGGMATLVFVYVVRGDDDDDGVPDDHDGDGISIGGDALRLDGAHRIGNGAGDDAELAHDAVGAQPGNMVDGGRRAGVHTHEAFTHSHSHFDDGKGFYTETYPEHPHQGHEHPDKANGHPSGMLPGEHLHHAQEDPDLSQFGPDLRTHGGVEHTHRCFDLEPSCNQGANSRGHGDELGLPIEVTHAHAEDPEPGHGFDWKAWFEEGGSGALVTVADAEAVRGEDATVAFAVRVGYATADGTATAGEDYGETAGVLEIPPGETPAPSTPPEIERIAVVSTPRLVSRDGTEPDTYGEGETIRIEVRFDQPVLVEGDPELGLSVGGRREAEYASGSGTERLVFAYLVLEVDADRDGIWIGADAIEVVYGDHIRNAAGQEADLSRSGAQHLSVADAEAAEADGAMEFTVRLEPRGLGLVRVDYATAQGTATAGVDYTESSGTLTFASLETERTVSVPILDDRFEDTGERFMLTLSNPRGAEIADGDGGVAILLGADRDCAEPGAICTRGEPRRKLTNSPSATVAGPAGAANAPATGAPAIAGKLRVGETLSALTWGIADEDGLESVSFSYQWLRDDAEMAGATGLTYTLADSDEGKAIRVRVSFTDDGGSDESLTSAATAPVERAGDAEPPAKPRGLSGQATHDRVALTWDDPQDGSITGYVILRRVRENDTGGEFSELVADTGTAATTYTDDTVAAGTTYTYRIKAINEHGVSERSRWLHIDTPEAPERDNSPATGAPTINGTAQVGETLKAGTSGIADPDGLEDASFTYQWLGDGSAIQDATANTYTLADSDEGKAVRVKVSFTDDEGNEETLSSGATAAVAAAEPTEPPAKPRGLSGQATHDRVALTWDDPQDDSITGYVILRRVRENDTGGAFDELVADTGTARTTYTDDTVKANTTYTYRIKAINRHGVSERSRWFHIDTPEAP